MALRKARAAPSGRRRPCSQFCTASRPKAEAPGELALGHAELAADRLDVDLGRDQRMSGDRMSQMHNDHPEPSEMRCGYRAWPDRLCLFLPRAPYREVENNASGQGDVARRSAAISAGKGSPSDAPDRAPGIGRDVRAR
jgi:hypothetical protein